MEGLEASIVTAGVLNEEHRFDAQFFQKAYLAEGQALNGHTLSTISEFAFVTDGPHGYHEVDDGSPIAMLTAKCVSDWFAEREGADTIARWVDDANKRSSLEVNDLILSTRGTVGNCAVVTFEALPANLDQDVARIAMLENSPFQPLFLLAYLNSRFGQDHIARHSSGMVQQGLSLTKVRDIPVPLLSEPFQVRVSDTIEESLRLRRETRAKHKEAEDTLLEALGLADWKPPEPLSYTARASDAFTAGRLDAQYFRPLFVQVEQLLDNTGRAARLGAVLSTNVRGRQPNYANKGLPVINSKHVRTNRVVLSDNRTAIEMGSPVIVEEGDVLVNGTGVGTIGRSAPFLHDQRALPDNHVTVLRSAHVDPVYLAVFLNSPLGQWQIERHIKGSSGQIELYPRDIAKIVFWDAPADIQTAVRDAVLSAFTKERRAQELLEFAKHAVEIAIEDGEAAAMTFLA